MARSAAATRARPIARAGWIAGALVRLRTRDVWEPAGVFALALLLRVVHVIFWAKVLLADDAVFFERHARQFLAAWESAGTASFWPLLHQAIDDASLQGVLFPLFASAVYRLAGGVEHTALVAVQAVLGALAAWLTYLTARRAYGSGVALGAGILVAIYPPLVLASGWLLAEALLTLVQALAIYALVRGLEPGAWRARLAGGVCAGLYMLRPAFQYTGLLLGLALLAAGLWDNWRPISARLRRAAALVAPYAAGVLLVALPWVALNGLVYGQFAWSRNGDAWHQVYWGIYPPNHGWWPPDSPVPPKYGVESLPGARAAGLQIEERDIDYFWAALDQVRATPLKAAATEINKLYQAYLHPSNTYGELPAALRAAAVPLHRTLVLLALFGLAIGWQVPRHRPDAWLVLGTFLLASALPFLASHIDLRYTVPPAQVAAIFAGLALTCLLSALWTTRRRWLRLSWLALAIALPWAAWWLDVPQVLVLAPAAAPWLLHLGHTALMAVAFIVAGWSIGRALVGSPAGPGHDAAAAPTAPSKRRAPVAGALVHRGRSPSPLPLGWKPAGTVRPPVLVAACTLAGLVLAMAYTSEALYEGDWHQWTVALRPGDAARQTFVLPAGWQAPPEARAELRLYLQGAPEPDYEPVVLVNGQELARLGPAFTDAGPLRFWAQIMVAARNQGKTRAEVPQWYTVPVDPRLLRGQVEVELVVEPHLPDGSAAGAAEPRVWLWGDYPPRPGQRLYEGPAVYSRIDGQDQAFLKYIATGEYGLWRWLGLASERAEAAWRPGVGSAWQTRDLSAAPGIQQGEYRMRLLVLGPAGNLIAAF